MTQPTRLREHMRAHLVLGLPLIGSHLAQTAINMTDTVMLGWYDVKALAALVLATTLFIVLFLFGSGFAFAVMPMVAAAGENGDETQVRRVTRMGLWISVGFALVVLPVLLFAGPVLSALGQEPELAAGAQTYLRVMGWGIVPALMVMVLKSYLSALERTRVQLLVTLGAAGLNAVLNYALIFGHWGAPELGIRGAAIASLAVNVFSVVLLAVYATRVFPGHGLFARLWRPDWEALRQVFSMGRQIGLTLLAEVALFSASSIVVGWIGTVELAAHGIALQITTIAFMVQVGLSNAATVRAGRAFGRGDVVALRQGALGVIVLGLGWALVAVLAFLAVPELLVGFFVAPDDPLRGAILSVGRGLLAMAALFQLADASQVIAVALLRGVQDTRAPMWIAAAAYWLIGAPMSYVFGIGLGLGAIGVWLGLVLGLGAAAVMLMARFWRGAARGAA